MDFLDPIFGAKPASPNSWLITGDESLTDILGRPILAWINYHQREVHTKQCHWLGHRALKNPMDAWIYQEIISETTPDLVIEIGNKNGGSTLYLAGICELLGHGQVLAIDIDHSEFDSFHPRIELITGDCGDETLVADVRRRCLGKKVLIIHDADHSADTVLRDLRNFTPMVSLGSYMIIEDSIIGLPGFSRDIDHPVGQFLIPRKGTPLQAINKFINENPNFSIDQSRERYYLTHNYRGFLRRVT